MKYKPHRIKVEESEDPYRVRMGHKPSVPLIRLKGRWLAEAGFRAGKHVRVDVYDGQIVITQE